MRAEGARPRRLPVLLVLVLGALALAPRTPAGLEPLPVSRAAAPADPVRLQLSREDLEALWVGPFRAAWRLAPPARPYLLMAPALGLALTRALEAPLLPVIAPLEKLRGLRFAHPVPWDVKQPEEVRAFMAEVLERDYPEERSDFDQLLLTRLGLAPAGFDLRPFLLDLMAEQVQGAYDPKVGTFFMVPQSRNWLNRLLDSGGPSQDELVTLHELDHALQDQHFDLEALQEVLAEPRNTDREMGLQALVEGDATLVMFQHLVVARGGRPEEVGSVAWMTGMVGGMPGMGEFGRAPLYFQRALIFPYYSGMDLVLRQYHQGGWSAVDRMYADPPASTEQVLHPEKYGLEPPREVRVPLPEAWHGWKSVGEDTGGEFLLRVLLEHHGLPGAEEAATGWGGDRLRLYRRGTGTMLVWATAWDSPEDAAEFEEAASEALCLARGPWRLWRSGDRVALAQALPPELEAEARRALLGEASR